MKRLLFPTLLLLLGSCNNSFDKRLQQEAIDYTSKHCPQKLDSHTTLDSAVYDPASRTYIRYLTLSPSAAAAVMLDTSAVRPVLVEELRNDPSWKACKDEGISFSYVYRTDGKTEAVYQTTLTRSDYSR